MQSARGMIAISLTNEFLAVNSSSHFHFIYLFQTQRSIEKETNERTNRQTDKQTQTDKERS